MTWKFFIIPYVFRNWFVINFYFVYLPDIQRYKSKNYNNHNYNQIKKIINDLKIDFIDIHNEVFLEEKKPINLFAYKISRHYNVEGYKKIANKIYEMTK